MEYSTVNPGDGVAIWSCEILSVHYTPLLSVAKMRCNMDAVERSFDGNSIVCSFKYKTDNVM